MLSNTIKILSNNVKILSNAIECYQNAINVIQIATGKGVGSTGEQTYDPALWKTIENIGQISIADGALKSKKVQKEKITAVGKNIKKIFDYLEGPSLLQGIG